MNQEYLEKFVPRKQTVCFGEVSCGVAYLKEEYEEALIDLLFERGEEYALRGQALAEQIALCRFSDEALPYALHNRKFNRIPSRQEEREQAFDGGYAVSKPHRGTVWCVLSTRDGLFLGFLIDGNHMLYIGETVFIHDIDTSRDNNGAGYKGGEDSSYSLSLVLDPTLGAPTSSLTVVAGQVALPDGVTEIPPYALADNGEITDLILPEGVTAIGRHAFAGCTALRRVCLPSSLREIGVSAFAGCTALREIVLPTGVETVKPHAFEGCASLSRAVLPAVRRVQAYAFFACSSLSEILPDGTEQLDAYAFDGCDALRELVLPEGVKRLGFAAFQECHRLERAVLPASLEEMDEFLFNQCDALREVVLPAAQEQAFREGMRGSWRSDRRPLLPQIEIRTV